MPLIRQMGLDRDPIIFSPQEQVDFRCHRSDERVRLLEIDKVELTKQCYPPAPAGRSGALGDARPYPSSKDELRYGSISLPFVWRISGPRCSYSVSGKVSGGISGCKTSISKTSSMISE